MKLLSEEENKGKVSRGKQTGGLTESVTCRMLESFFVSSVQFLFLFFVINAAKHREVEKTAAQ